MKRCFLYLVFILISGCSKENNENFLTGVSNPEINLFTLEPIVGLQDVNILINSTSRTFKIYVPSKYSSLKDMPLLFCFHGYTSNAKNIMDYSNFNKIADREGFIVVYPQGLEFNGSTHWNVGGWTLGSSADDIKFVELMIELISDIFLVNKKRIYSTGMSNGGFMSFLLACQLSNKIASIASVSGSMTPQIYNECDPKRSISILQLHGDSDPVVPYLGYPSLFKSVSDVISFWTNNNSCETRAFISEIEDINLTDNSTVKEYYYKSCNEDTSVKHYKVIGGGHDWFGVGGNKDINSSELIWDFLSQYNLNGRID